MIPEGLPGMAAALHPESSPRPPAGRRALFLTAGTVVLSTLTLAGWWFVSSRNTETIDDSKTTALTQPKTAPVAFSNPRGYVGIQACEECHAERVKEFKSTRHYLACMPP